MVRITKNKIKPGVLIVTILILILFALCFHFLSGYSQQINAAMEDSPQTAQNVTQQRQVATGRTLGFISLIPAIITILLAFTTKEVLLSLFIGVLSGASILEGINGSGSFFSRIGSVFNAVCDTALQITTDSFRMAVLILCLAIGGMVAVINAAGGFSALGRQITKGINTPRKSQIMAQIMGIFLFFDDYANSLIIGPVMRDITDKQGVSREKLAYIVDSTAAPVAGIAIVSSWIAAELSAIESGFEVAGIQGSAYVHFLGSIPFSFYNFAALAFMFILSLTGREYGPMLSAERRARAGEPLKKGTKTGRETPDTEANMEAGSIWSVILPVLVLLIYAFAGFYINGMQNAIDAGMLSAEAGFSFSLLSTVFSYADTVTILMRASILASLVSILMGSLTGKTNIMEGINQWIKGASDILLTVVILVLAWSLSAIVGQLGTAYYLVDIVTLNLPYWLLPMLIFIVCCFISFAAGSFGCMVIVMPIAVPIAYQTALLGGIGYGEQLLFACIAAVLSGSIFGDHCSPVTDTTILSSIGAGCDNIDHVRTQLPYALTSAAIAALFGYLPAGLGVSPAISIPALIIAGIVIIRVAGKKVSIEDFEPSTV